MRTRNHVVQLRPPARGPTGKAAVGAETSPEYLSRIDLTMRYGQLWWRHDPTVDDLCKRIPGLRHQLESAEASGEVTTESVYAERHPPMLWPADWRPPRRPNQIHALSSISAGRPLLGTPPLPALAYILVGLPGSGKTTALQPIAWQHYESHLERRDRDRANHAGLPAGAAVLDADLIRIALPEYRGGLGSSVLQPETATLTYGPYRDRLLASAPSGILFDTVGDPYYLPREAQALSALGYAVHVLAASIDVDVAVDRVARRCIATGRFVGLEYLRSRAGAPEAAMAALMASPVALGGWGVWDTGSVPARQTRGGGAFSLGGAPGPP